MGCQLSTPNFKPRQDQLFFPNEILYKITQWIAPRDMLRVKDVSRSWRTFVAINQPKFIGDSFGIYCVGSEHVIHQLAAIGFDGEDLRSLPVVFSALFLDNLELTRHFLSLQFWVRFSDTITRLEFTNCAVLPRTTITRVNSDGTVLNVDTKYSLGCPNLKKLALRDMDKSFMMGGDYLQFHQILHLENLKSLDVSDNKYLTDKILFDLLKETESLESLNLSKCPLVLARGVHNRFYPSHIDPTVVGFCDHILSVETIVNYFLKTEKGSHMREVLLKATPLTPYTLNLLSDATTFSWESLDMSYCRELKKRSVMSMVSAHSDTLRKLVLKSDGRSISALEVLPQVALPNLECLAIKNCCFRSGDFAFFLSMPKLRTLECACISEADSRTGPLEHRPEFVIATLKNVTSLNLSNSRDFVDDNMFQLLIRTMRCLKKLNVSGCDRLTDAGVAGVTNSPSLFILGNSEETEPSFKSVLSELVLSEAPRFRNSNKQVDWIALHVELDNTINGKNFPKAMSYSTYDQVRVGNSLAELKCLEEVDVSRCDLLSSPTWHFAFQLPSLFRLNISYCTRLSLNSVGVVFQNCPSLEYLIAIQSNPLITQEPFRGFAKHSLKRLREIVV